MSVRFNCPQGHQWEAALDSPSITTSQSLTCPRCGLPPLPEEKYRPTSDITPASGLEAGMLRTATFFEAAPTGPEFPSPEDSSAASPRVPGYEVVRELGRGGMGVVYLAWQVALKRPVALKMILAGTHAQPEDLARFQAEAESVARLQHPHVVQIHEVGHHEGKPYFSLEYAEGGSLSRKLAGKPMKPQAAAELVKTLAEAIQAAHERGIVHRDLKPANILLTRAGVPKVTDFGLAKRLDQDSGQTISGSIVGTPSYMAPEQANGSLEIGPAVDVYALGAILYELLTGRPPFSGATVLDTLDQVRHQDPVLPTRLQPKVPRDLETICLKCLQKEKDRRYESAQGLADDLHRFLNDEPIHARPIGWLERGRKWARRRPAVAALLGAILVVTAVGFGLVTWKWLEAEENRKQADIARGDALGLYVKEQLAHNAAEQARIDAVEQRNQARLAQKKEELKAYQSDVNLSDREFVDAQVGRAEELLDRCPPHLCHWEWFYHKRRLRSELLLLPGETAVAYSPDGQLLAAGRRDDVVVWDAETGREVARFVGHKRRVTCLAFSTDGRFLASGSQDQQVKIWDLDKRRETRTLGPVKDWVLGIAFKPREPVLVVVSGTHGASGQVSAWNTDTGQPHFSALPSKDAVLCVAFHPDGKQFAVGTREGRVKLYESDTGKELPTLESNAERVYSLAFRPDGRYLAAGSLGNVRLWDLADPARKPIDLRAHNGWVFGMAFTPDSRHFITAGMDRTIKVWDLNTRRELFVLRGHRDQVDALAMNPDGQRIASVGKEGALRVWNLAEQQSRNLAGPRETILDAVFSPDSKWVASAVVDKGSGSHVVKVRDVATGQLLCTYVGTLEYIWAVAFHPDGKQLASAGEDGIVRLWDAHTGKQLRELTGHKDVVHSVAFSPDGKLLASGSADRSIRIWNLESGQEVGCLRQAGHGLSRLAFSPDGKHLVWGGDDSEARPAVHLLWPARVFEVASGKEVFHLSGHTGPVMGVAYSPNGKVLATSGDDNGAVRLWEAATGKELLQLRGHSGRVRRVAFSKDSRRLLSTSQDGTFKLWDVANGQEVLTLHQFQVGGATFSPDGRRVVSFGPAILKLWETLEGPIARTYHGHASGVTNVAIRPDGNSFATTSTDSTVKLWERMPGPMPRTLSGHRFIVAGVDFSPDGRRLASSGHDGWVRIWDSDTGQELRALGRFNKQILTVAFSPDGKLLASAGMEKTIRLWDADTGEARGVIEGPAEQVRSLAFHPNGQWLASVSKENVLRIWDVASGKEVLALEGHAGDVNGVAFSPDGRLLASASSDRTVKLWDAATGKEVRTIEASDHPVSDVAFSPDGKRLASCGADCKVRVWDAATGQELHTLTGHLDTVLRVKFHPDGRYLVSVSLDRTMKLWDLAPRWAEKEE